MSALFISIMTSELVTLADTLISERRSIRAFRPDPVSHDDIVSILQLASTAPSATNLQPWRVHMLTGETRQRVIERVCRAYDEEPEKHASEHKTYPDEFFEPYLSRRRAVGYGMYSLLGIAREDKEARRLQLRKNFEFFGAPVGLIFTIDRRLALGSWLDYGFFLQNLMIAARARGLETCCQGLWCRFHRVLREELPLTAEEQVVCGMALGYADHDAVINTLRSERVPVAAFASFHK